MTRLFLLVAALLVAPTLAAQGSPTYAGVTVTRAPLDAATAGTSVQLTRDADLSPFPSFIDYPSESVADTWLVGAAVGHRPTGTSGLTWRAGLETSLVYSALTDSGPSIDITTGELGAGYLVRINPMLGLELGLGGLLGFANGTVGTVGSRAGDVFLISPDDGERYETDSEITATGLGFGLGATLDVVVGPITAGVGYRLASPIDSWEYRVQDADTPERSSRLPSEGFASNPPTYDLDGLHLRVGVAIPLGGPRPSRVPVPSQAYPPPPPEATVAEPEPYEPEPIAEPAPDPLLGVPAPGRDRIRWVQARLNDRGYACGDVDGRSGPNTRRCIRAYRLDVGLSGTSDIDDDLLALLNTPQ